MFKIYDGRKQFYQWDLDRKIIVNDNSINQVHFCNRTDECSLVCEVYEEDGKRLVNVPNVLLQTDWRINVYGYDKNYTKHCATFEVVKRSKPEGYVYTETEILNYNTLLDMIENIEGGNVDLSNYYTKPEVDELIGKTVYKITIDHYTSDEITKQSLEDIYSRIEYMNDRDFVVVDNNKGLITEIVRDGNTLIFKRLLNLDTVESTTITFNDDGTLNTSVYPKYSYSNVNADLVFIHQNYSPTGEDINVASAIKYLADNQSNVDLSEYAKKSDIPDTTGFTTEEEVNELINTALGVIENGTY